MARRYTGGFLSSKEQVTDANTSNGVFTLSEHQERTALGNFPTGRWTPSRSLRFRSNASAHLSRTPASTGNRRIWTWSAWIKKSSDGGGQFITAGGSSVSNGFSTVGISSDSAYVVFYSSSSHVYTSPALFRDTSAWYHMVYTIDTTQSITSERVKLYVNGIPQTLNVLGGYTAVPQNFDCSINTAGQGQIIGAIRNGSGNLTAFHEGYMSEVNFIDGQALDPSYFGFTDPETGTWVPKRYTGSYGTNGFYLPFSDNTGLDQLGRDFGNGGSELITNGFFDANVTGWSTWPGVGGSPFITWQSTGKARIGNTQNNGTIYYQAITTEIGKTYYATASVSNISIGANGRTCALQWASSLGGAVTTIGSIAQPNSGTITGSFVATSTTSYILLNVDVLGSGTQGADWDSISVSDTSIKNHWNTNNFSLTAGTTYDSMVDVPGIAAVAAQNDIGGVQRGNYATWNLLSPPVQSTLSQGNLLSTATGSSTDVITTFPMPSTGKWYAEIGISVSPNINWPMNMGISSGIGGNTYCRLYTDWSAFYLFYSVMGVTSNQSLNTTLPANGDILKIAYDADTGKIWLGLNSNWYANNGTLTGSPETNNNPTLNGVAGLEMYPNHSNAGGPAQNAYINCGQRPFAYTPPAGFRSLCTTNLPNPLIKRPSDHFDVKTWTGNGNSQTIGTTNKQTSSYQIARSLRFRKANSAFLSRTATTLGSQTTWTWSGWVKQTLFGSNGTQWLLTGGDPAAIATNYTTLAFSAQGFLGNTNQLQFYSTQSNSSVFALASNARFESNTGWYHVVAVIDTTQTVPSERIKLYVNGVRITQWSSTTFPSQNATIPFINGTTFESRIGGIVTYGNYDGYMTEINFVDGQALTPSSFGQFDANNNWVPTRYTGTYGTNGYYLPFNHNTTSSWAATFNGSQYLTVPDSSVWAFSGNWTVEAFFNISSIPGTLASIVAQWVDGGGTNRAFTIGVDSSARLTAYAQYGANQYNPVSASGLIKVNQWYHTALVANGSTLTLYLNGVAISSSSITGTINNSTAPVGIGAYGDGTWKTNGSISNVRITNTAVYTSKFTPPSAALTAISGTQLLTLQNSTFVDNSTNNFTITNVGSTTLSSDNPFILPSIGADQSGNINNWIPNNFSTTAGVTNDSVLDSPTDYDDGSGNIRGNYPVLNSLENVNTTYLAFQNGSLRANMGTGVGTMAWANMAIPPSGKWYWEVTITTVSNGTALGISYGASSTTDGNAKSIIYSFPGGKRVLTVDTSYGASYTTGDIIGVAVDKDASTITFYKNNVSQGAISEPTISSQNYRPFLHNNTSSGFGLMDINFGQQPFAYTPPAGYKALNTKNLKDIGSFNLPDTFGNYVNTPDLIWIKNRSNTYNHILQDTVRGTDVYLDLTSGAQSPATTAVQAFLPNGFQIGSIAGGNANTENIVGWTWNRGRIPGFDIVSYAGNSTSSQTISHNLGVKPAMMVVKSLSSGVASWASWNVWHQSLSNQAQSYLRLGENLTVNTSSVVWGNAAPGNSTFTVGWNAGAGLNGSGDNFVAYLWAEVPGFSRFGSYIGTGATEGRFNYTGFRARWIMIKRTDATNDWIIYDTQRQRFNTGTADATVFLRANTAAVEDTDPVIDVMANGFKVNGTAAFHNASGGTYVYAAFAEYPFKYANAR